MGTTRYWRDVSGILLLDKARGPTSNHALKRIRWLYEAKRAGHTGSLDPMATGLLPVCLGQATKIAAFLLDADKRYRATLKLGVKTDSGDAEGDVVDEAQVPPLSDATIEAAMAQLRGDIEQIPPMFSALHHKGRRLYELAREGKVVERKPRSVRIHELGLVERSESELVFDVRCSKGTYVRTLGEDLATLLGSVGHLTALRRTGLGPFDGLPLVQVEAVEEAAERGGLEALDRQLLAPDVGLAEMPELTVEEDEARRLVHGQRLPGGDGYAPGLHRAYGPNRAFLGIVCRESDGRLKPHRLFVAPGQRNA